MMAYVNGNLVPEQDAGVAVFDHGLTVGDGVFETIAVRGGVALAPTRHLARLERSARGLGLPPPDVNAIRTGILETIAANRSIGRGAVRVTYTSGIGTVGSVRGGDDTTVVIGIREVQPGPDAVRVATVPWPRNERGALVGLKTTSYAENVRALADARRRGADEAIFGNTAGDLCEGSGTNVFLAVSGRLITPPLSTGCLAGITRALLMERCGLDIEERAVPLPGLAEADEAFLTSATRDVQAIQAVDAHLLAQAPGPLTTMAAASYADLLTRDADPN
jgi:branched-chain amino acid aminotransferase